LLKARTFKRVVPAVVRGKRTAIVEADLARFNRIISSIAFAIYFRETGVRWQRDWLVYSSTMVAGKVAFEGRPDPLNPSLRATLADIPFEVRDVPQPAVFQYSVFEEGTDDLLETIEKVRQRPNPSLRILGVVITMHDKRTALARDIREQIQKVFGSKVFRTVISKSVRLEESPAYKESIFTFAPDSTGATDYYSLCEEVIERAEARTA
jgi:hypothetical protein